MKDRGAPKINLPAEKEFDILYENILKTEESNQHGHIKYAPITTNIIANFFNSIYLQFKFFSKFYKINNCKIKLDKTKQNILLYY